jgi:hypothetical protein
MYNLQLYAILFGFYLFQDSPDSYTLRIQIYQQFILNNM